jgi:simple sugar transport system permease protein
MKKGKIDIRNILAKNAVLILFVVISGIAIPLSQYSGFYLIKEITTRLGRDSFLVLALLLPVMAGMGINFGIVLGAMGGQIALILVTDWGITGAPGMLVAMAITTPIAIVLGYFAGVVLNKAKGREMITSFILAFFMSGVYQLVVLYGMGTIIPVKSPRLVLTRGYGIRNAISLPGIKGSFDKFFDRMFNVHIAINNVPIPIASFLIVGLLCILTIWIRKTKLGQEIRAVGQDMTVAATSGINVEKTRIIAIVISTVLAGYGQLMYLQNIGTMATYNGTDSLALFAAAALLVGGATVNRATIPNVFIGTALFHLMFVVMPLAGNNLFGSAIIGEYFRVFISYAVVTIALVIHAWNRLREKELARRSLRDMQPKSGI